MPNAPPQRRGRSTHKPKCNNLNKISILAKNNYDYKKKIPKIYYRYYRRISCHNRDYVVGVDTLSISNINSRISRLACCSAGRWCKSLTYKQILWLFTHISVCRQRSSRMHVNYANSTSFLVVAALTPHALRLWRKKSHLTHHSGKGQYIRYLKTPTQGI